MLINGIQVTLINEVVTGQDALGNDIYTEVEMTVDDVLVAPTSTDDNIDNTNLWGKTSQYQIAIPKGDTHIWKDQKVRFFGKTWRIFGEAIEGIESNIPLRWNAKWNVEHYE